MNKTIIYLLVILFCSCSNQQNKIKIEIYLLKNRILSNEGVKLKTSQLFKKLKLDTVPFYKERENEKFDTISKQLIYGGKFYATKKDLQKKPLINNEEILSLDLKNSEIKISESGAKKIDSFQNNSFTGRQFVIAVNGKPQLTGYFRCSCSSNIINWNYIHYYIKIENQKTKENNILKIQQNKDYTHWLPVSTKIADYKELVNAFIHTNRIKK